VIREDLTVMKVPEEKWYNEAAISRSEWRTICKKGLETVTVIMITQRVRNL
jgi:hypothetical protein